MTQESPTLTPEQAADRLKAAGVPRSGETVRRWVRSGRLAGAIVLPSGQIRIPVAVIDAITKGGADAAAAVDQAEAVPTSPRQAAKAEAAQDQAAQKGLTNPSHHQ